MILFILDVTVLNLGGGFKVGRMNYEYSTDLQNVGAPVKVMLIYRDDILILYRKLF